MTVVVDNTATTKAVHVEPADRLASWHVRAGALAVDLLPGAAVVATMALVALSVPLRSTWWWMCVSLIGLAILFMAVNRLLLPTITGWSLGRAVCGIRVIRDDGEAVGPWRLLLRDLAHLVDTVSVLVGWLWPLWDSRRRTFADLLLRTEVRLVNPDRRPGTLSRLTGVLVLTAALLCLGGTAMGYVVVYRHDRALDQVRAQIAIQGPKIAAEMLTYDPKTLQSNFEHARSLTTDKYRDQLTAQQQAVQKGKPVTNQYWVVDSAIRSVSINHATMLLFMQGQRGLPPNERYISATVRVTFARGADARWRVDDLTVLTKPGPAGHGK
ncbi:RDD family protein [uncultured Mycobacterium sp.]|uniref:RDD family protein n=1 Tax=uncultured Mycobacterium sp. TaxID=171292 RepID=UPI0035CB5068